MRHTAIVRLIKRYLLSSKMCTASITPLIVPVFFASYAMLMRESYPANAPTNTHDTHDEQPARLLVSTTIALRFWQPPG